MLFPKSAQTKKHKKDNPKKLPKPTLQNFIDTIFKLSKGKCQICKVNKIDEYHHALYGNFGADKDDRSLVGICRECHYCIHHGKNGGSQKLRQNAVLVGENNWSFFNGETYKA